MPRRPPTAKDDSGPQELMIQSVSDGIMTGVIAGVFPFTLELQKNVVGSDEAAPGGSEES